MWQLKMAERGKEWVTVSSFETLTDAARKIIELEGYPVTGIFFDILIETGIAAQSEHDAFAHLEHTGTNRCYVVRRIH